MALEGIGLSDAFLLKGLKMKLFNLLIGILIDDSTRERLQQEGKEIKGFRGFLRVFPGHFYHLSLYNPFGLLAGVTPLIGIFNTLMRLSRLDQTSKLAMSVPNNMDLFFHYFC